MIDRQLWLSQIQLLWDRGEANGYAQHMTTDPLPDTPRHKVLMHVAFGDHQVSDTTAEVEARTIGARAYQPALDAGPLAVAAPPADPADRELPVRRVGDRVLGHRARQDGRHGDRGHGAPPQTNTPNRSGRRPA